MTGRTRGTAVERKPGIWLIQATGGDGKKQSRIVHATRSRAGVIPREVEKAKAALVAEVDLRRPAGDAGPTVRQVIDEWFAQADLEATTRRGYDSKIRTMILPSLGDMDVRALTPLLLSTWHDALKVTTTRRGGAPKGASIRQAHAIVRKALAYGCLHGYLSVNPAAGFGPGGSGAAAQAEIVSPERGEVERLLAACEDPQERMWLLLSTNLGGRRSETLALRWCNVNLDDGSITIDGAIDPADRHRRIKSTKTHQTGTLSIGPKLVEELREYQAWALARAEQAGGVITPDCYLFSREPRGWVPWDPSYATALFGRIRARAGVGAHVQLKTLRHFHATQLVSAGVPINVVAARLRHANSSTTMQFYAKSDRRADREAAAVFESL